MVHWDRFAFAGRMQKPILTLIEDDEVSEAQVQNRKSAINLALLLHYGKVDEVPIFDIFETLCNFSYKGDIRMRWKFENADKVKNIV